MTCKQKKKKKREREKNWNASKLDTCLDTMIHETIQYANVKHKIAILRESDDFGRNKP